MEKRSGINGLRSREKWFTSFPLLVCLAAFGQPYSAAAHNAIIVDDPISGNKSAVYFQEEKAPIKLRSLEEVTEPAENSGSADKQVNIIVPSSPAVPFSGQNVSIQFQAEPETAGGVISKGLLYSDDRGEHWHEYGGVRPAAEGDTFTFSAPRDGEYWFALHLIHQDGSESASRAQKFLVSTGSNGGGIGGGVPSADSGDRMGQGLMSLTQKSTPAQQTGASGSDPLTSRLNEIGGQNTAPAGGSPNTPNNIEGERAFPGKIAWVEKGKTQSGNPGISVTWFRPEQVNGEKSEGKIRIERAPSPNGPWTPVSEDAADLDVNGYGYWFDAKGETDPFYLRAVTVVKMDGTDTEWIDTLPKPIDFSNRPNTAKSDPSNFANASMEKPADAEKGADTSIKAWSDSAPESGNETKVAERDSRSSVVDKTSSASQVEERSSGFSAKGSGAEIAKASAHASHPQLTDPQELSVNPIFRFGLGVFTGKDQNGNRLPDYSDAGNAPAYTENATQPAPPQKRPIWMSKQDYEVMVQNYENEQRQLQQAAQLREVQRKQQEEFKRTAQGGIPGGQKATITDAQGNELNITEGSVVYQDEKGNISATPFPGQNTGVIGDMSFPDQPFNGGQPMMIDGQSVPVNGQPITMNGGTLYQPDSMNSFGDPYTNKEQTLGGDTYDMTSVPNQSLLPSSLPPKPETQQ